MNQIEIGIFIAKKRKENNMTQANLAEKLGVTNKTISKWENGKCMPDYNVVQSLCDELGITSAELMDAEENEPDSIRTYDDQQILELLRRTQDLEDQKNFLLGIMLVVMGIALCTLHFQFGGSDFLDFCSGLCLGLSIGVMVIGVYVIARFFPKINQ